MKNEADKIKTRANIGANDADWATIRQGVLASGKEQSIFLREAAIQKARSVLARKAGK